MAALALPLALGLFIAAICTRNDATVSGPLAWGGAFYMGVYILLLGIL